MTGPGRKMGHVTALGQTLEEARATAQRAADCIRFGGARG
jgi:phosphoribosylaminoimidazole carboxylase (NCAIR synthetase)